MAHRRTSSRCSGTFDAHMTFTCMRTKTIVILAAFACLGACSQRDENSAGNGPGNADGFGGRDDPPAQQPADEHQQPAEEPQPQQQP